MYRFEYVDLGTYRGDNYFLVGFVEPEPSAGEDYDLDEDADEYGVTLVRAASTPLEDNTRIVRMDSSHGRPHLDELFLPADTDEGRNVWLEEGYEYSRMKRYLLEQWEQFVDRYARNRE